MRWDGMEWDGMGPCFYRISDGFAAHDSKRAEYPIEVRYGTLSAKSSISTYIHVLARPCRQQTQTHARMHPQTQTQTHTHTHKRVPPNRNRMGGATISSIVHDRDASFYRIWRNNCKQDRSISIDRRMRNAVRSFVRSVVSNKKGRKRFPIIASPVDTVWFCGTVRFGTVRFGTVR